jgi:hypothetical protein
VTEARKLRTAKDLEWDARFDSFSKQVCTDAQIAGPTVSKLPPPSEEAVIQLVRDYVEQMDQRSRKRLAADPPENEARKQEMWIHGGVEVQMLRDRDDPRGEQRVYAAAREIQETAGKSFDQSTLGFSELVRRALLELDRRYVARLHEIVVRREGAVINMVVHWQGGHHTALRVQLRLNAAGRHHWPPPEDTVALMRELARLMPDRQIARLLNRSGKPTGYGDGWTEQRVRGFRKHHDIAGYRDGEWAERGEITLDAAAQVIGVHKMTALRMIRRGDLKGQQACKGAPWVIKAEDVAMFAAQKQPRGPVTQSHAADVRVS